VPVEAQAFPSAGAAGGGLEELMLEEAKKGLAEYGRTVPPKLLAGTRVEVGSPWRAICAVAKEEFVDLIVVGSHGHGTLDRLLGTTSSRVVDSADRSVLVVRQPDVDLDVR
jgi:nucleotide-binding universal stress UspA family protein